MLVTFEKSPYTKFANDTLNMISEIENKEATGYDHDICELLKIQTVYMGLLLDTLSSMMAAFSMEMGE